MTYEQSCTLVSISEGVFSEQCITIPIPITIPDPVPPETFILLPDLPIPPIDLIPNLPSLLPDFDVRLPQATLPDIQFPGHVLDQFRALEPFLRDHWRSGPTIPSPQRLPLVVGMPEEKIIQEFSKRGYKIDLGRLDSIKAMAAAMEALARKEQDAFAKATEKMTRELADAREKVEQTVNVLVGHIAVSAGRIIDSDVEVTVSAPQQVGTSLLPAYAERTAAAAAAATGGYGPSVPLIPSEVISEVKGILGDEFVGQSGPFRDRLVATAERLVRAQPASPQGRAARELGIEAVRAAGQEFRSGNSETAEAYADLAMTCADIALGLIPGVGWAKDSYEALTGRSSLTGIELDETDRTLAVAGMLSGGAFSKVKVLRPILDKLGTLALSTAASKTIGYLKHWTTALTSPQMRRAVDTLQRTADPSLHNAMC